LIEIFDAVIKAGAKTINVPDTVGYAIPKSWGNLMNELISKVPNSHSVIWSTHCHNDLGMAVANSLAAVQNGARQVECTINGLGERAGNASLEEIVMAVKTRKDIFNLETKINTEQIVTTSKLVSSITGYPVQPNKAIVGANAFAHESGIHQDGVLKHRETYEIMRAQDVGWGANKISLGKLSGRNAFKNRLVELGIELDSDELLNSTFDRFKALADKKSEIYDEDIHALVTEEFVSGAVDRFKLISLKSITDTQKKPFAEIEITVEGELKNAKSEGGGPVDATFKAIELIAKSNTELLLYSVNNITSGTDSKGQVTVRLAKGGRVVNGLGSDTDIVIASSMAYLNALNKLVSKAERAHPQV
jgi:2-isopropylmalate synthase